MKYAQHRSNMRKVTRKTRPAWWLVASILLLAGIIIVLMVIFSENGSEEAAGVDQEVETSDQIDSFEEAPAESLSSFEEADVYYVEGGGVAGFARRGTEEGVFTHVMVADLPGVDLSTHYYEAWLVKPGVTEFFSTGEMFSREDGKFGLIWKASPEDESRNLFEFSKIVVTREVRDQDPSPSPIHVLEGGF